MAEAYRYELSGLDVDSVIVEPRPFPTVIWEKIAQVGGWGQVAQPADLERLKEYGQIGEIPGQISAGVMQMFAGADAPNPQAVADAVRDLVALPAGQRPLRTVVWQGAGFLENLNQTSDGHQAAMMELFGLSGLR